MDQIETGFQQRFLSIDKRENAIDEESRTVEISFSSDRPVERFFGDEILDHSGSAVRLERLKASAPLLWNHDTDQVIGVVENARIEDGRGMATVRFSKSSLGSEVFNDVVDGIRNNVSVGYVIHEMRLDSEDDNKATYRATDWEPLELSIVSVPADISVGVGREYEHFQTRVSNFVKPQKEPEMTDKVEKPEVDNGKRVSDLLAAAEKYDAMDMVRSYIDDERLTVGDFQQAILDKRSNQLEAEREERAKAEERAQRVEVKDNKPADEPMIADATPVERGEVGLTDKEARQFSYVKAIRAMANPTDKRAQEAAKFELEVSNAAQDKYRREARGFMVPDEVLKRDLVVGTATAGGHTVATELRGLIDLLRNKMMVIRAGATVFNGLQGDVAFPRQTGSATAYWVAENGSITESQQAFDQVPLTPHTVGALTEFSRKLMLQSTLDVERFVENDLATVLALEMDRAAINGAPDVTATANEPRGILNTSGIGSVVGGTNGGAPTWDDVVNLETAVAIDNADVGQLAYMVNAATRGVLKRTRKDSGSGIFLMDGGTINGYTAHVTNQMPSNIAKGSASNLSAAIFGNWSDLLIGQWSGVDILVDPYTNSATGAIRVVAFMDVDNAVRHAESFASMEDIITT